MKEDFFEFPVQRMIVNNIYLDNIASSVDKGEPFPAITLTYQGDLHQYMNDEGLIEPGKESDMHFTYANADVYIDGIDLMKIIVEKMEPVMVKVINDPAITGLKFSKQFEVAY